MKKSVRIVLGCFTAGFVVCGAGAQIQPASIDISRMVDQAASYELGQSLEALSALDELTRQSVGKPELRSQLELGLIRLMGPACTLEARQFACKQLAVVGSLEALPSFAKLLENPETTGMACLGLSTYPVGKADAVLRDALAKIKEASKIQVTHALGDRRDVKAVNILAELASGSDTILAGAAISSLGKIGDRAAAKALAKLDGSVKPELREILAEASLRCAEAAKSAGDFKTSAADYEKLLNAGQSAFVRRAAFEGLLRLDKDGGEKRIVNTLKANDAGLKPSAITRVRDLRSPGATERFALVLQAVPPQEQAWLIASLAEHRNAPARMAIANSLSSENSTVRRAAITALGSIGDSSSVPFLTRALNTATEGEERRAIESSLVSLSDGNRTDQALLRELKSFRGRGRGNLVTALARRQGPAANELLFVEGAGIDVESAKDAFLSLGRTATEQDVPRLLDQLTRVTNPEVLGEAAAASAKALARVEDVARRSTLVREGLSKASSTQGREGIIALLASCADAEALAAAKEACSDPEVAVREAGVHALADWPDSSAWNPLASIYLSPENEAFRGVALQGMVRIVGEENPKPGLELIERYRQLLLGSKSDNDLRLILGALGGAAHPQALELAMPMLDKPAVRKEAEVAVKRIAESIKGQHPEAAQNALKRLAGKS